MGFNSGFKGLIKSTTMRLAENMALKGQKRTDFIILVGKL